MFCLDETWHLGRSIPFHKIAWPLKLIHINNFTSNNMVKQKAVTGTGHAEYRSGLYFRLSLFLFCRNIWRFLLVSWCKPGFWSNEVVRFSRIYPLPPSPINANDCLEQHQRSSMIGNAISFRFFWKKIIEKRYNVPPGNGFEIEIENGPIGTISARDTMYSSCRSPAE